MMIVPTVSRTAESAGVPFSGGAGGSIATPQVQASKVGGSALRPGVLSLPTAQNNGEVGRAVSRLGNQMLDTTLQIQDYANEVALTEASSKVDNLTLETQKQLKGLNGKNAIGIRDTYGKAYEDGLKSIREGIGTEIAKQAFDKIAARERLSMFGALDTVERAGLDQVAEMSVKAKMQTATERAKAEYGDPAKYEQIIADGAGAMRIYMENQGAPVEAIVAKEAEYRQSVYKQIAQEQAIASPDAVLQSAGDAIHATRSHDDIAKFIIKELEGGFVANDGGKGATKYGINQTANPDVDVANLTPEAAGEIIKKRYIDPVVTEDMSGPMALIAADAAVNHGVDKAQKLIAQAEGDPNRLLQLRKEEYRRLASENPEKYRKYLDGWIDRLEKVRFAATGPVTGNRAFDMLGPSDQREVLNHAETQQRRNQAAYRVELNDKLRDSEARAGYGVPDTTPIPQASFVQAMGAEEGAMAYEKYIGTQRFAMAYSTVKVKTDAEQMALLTQYAPRPDSSAESLQSYAALTKAVEQSQKDRRDDPLTFALQNGLATRVEPLEFGDTKTMEAQMLRRADAAITMTQLYNVPLKLFTKAEEKALSTALAIQPPEGQENLLLGMANSLSAETYDAAIGQIYSGGAPLVAAAGGYLKAGQEGAEGGRDVAIAILRGNSLLDPPKGEDGKERAKPFPMPPQGVDDVIRAAIPDGVFAYNPDAADIAYRAARAWYADDAAKAGDITGEENSDRAEKAVEAVIGKPVDVGESEVLPPWGMEEDLFLDKLKSAWAATRAANETLYLPESYEDARLIQIGNGTYAVMAGKDFVRDMFGKPVAIDVLAEDGGTP